MSASIVKIRSAISEFAMNEGRDGKIGTALNYLTWQELIHTSYFEVPEFRKLLARIVSDSDGFRATDQFVQDAAYHETESWLRELQAKGPIESVIS